jgi:hypothetical protein
MKTVKRPLGESLSDLAEALAEVHERCFRERPRDQLDPTFMLIGQNGAAEIFTLPIRDPQSREIILNALRQMLTIPDFVAYAVWGEAWVAEAGAHERAQQAGASPYMNEWGEGHPDRMEVVSTTCVARSGEVVHLAQRIVRGEDGAVIRLEREASGATAFGGAFITLFPPHQIHA